MNNFSYFSTVRTMFNNDLAEGLSEAREVLGVDKAMIVTDPGVAALPIWGEMQAAMDSIGFACEPFTKGKPNPTDVTMTEAANALKASDCDVVIGFGGGVPSTRQRPRPCWPANPGELSAYYGKKIIF